MNDPIGDDARELEVSAECRVTIDKFYGPLFMPTLRVTIDYDRAEWVINAQHFYEDARGNIVDRWVEAARIGCDAPPPPAPTDPAPPAASR